MNINHPLLGNVLVIAISLFVAFGVNSLRKKIAVRRLEGEPPPDPLGGREGARQNVFREIETTSRQLSRDRYHPGSRKSGRTVRMLKAAKQGGWIITTSRSHSASIRKDIVVHGLEKRGLVVLTVHELKSYWQCRSAPASISVDHYTVESLDSSAYLELEFLIKAILSRTVTNER